MERQLHKEKNNESKKHPTWSRCGYRRWNRFWGHDGHDGHATHDRADGRIAHRWSGISGSHRHQRSDRRILRADFSFSGPRDRIWPRLRRTLRRRLVGSRSADVDAPHDGNGPGSELERRGRRRYVAEPRRTPHLWIDPGLYLCLARTPSESGVDDRPASLAHGLIRTAPLPERTEAECSSGRVRSRNRNSVSVSDLPVPMLCDGTRQWWVPAAGVAKGEALQRAALDRFSRRTLHREANR